jgi:hypothetical protein
MAYKAFEHFSCGKKLFGQIKQNPTNERPNQG